MLFAFLEDEVYPDDAKAMETKKIFASILCVIIQLAGFCAELFIFYMMHRKCQVALGLMLRFHDYLIQYRLTPRSRILRKHLPKMAMVLEEESNMDTSSMMMS